MPAPTPVKLVHLVLGLNVGGLERVVLRLLAGLDRSRFTPAVVALDEPGALASELGPLGTPLHVMGRAPGLDAELVVRLAALLRREGASLLHTHNAAAHLYGTLAARLAGLAGLPGRRRPRVIHTKHGRGEPGAPRLVLVNRLASSLCDRVVAVSADAAAVALGIERVRADKVVTIGNGVPTDEFCPRADGAAARALLGVPRGGFHVGCVARLAAVKDHAALLDAFARLRAVRPDAHLTLVGDGPERASLEARRALLGLDAAVTFAGARADVAPLLAAFDVFALASRSEGMSLTLLEAASAGLPIVATRVGGNAEVVVDGETGVLVPAGDPTALAEALLAVARRPDRGALGAAGRARVQRRFSVERMAHAYAELYSEVLGIA